MPHLLPATILYVSATAILSGLIGNLASASDKVPDWPGFRGPERTGRCEETGLLHEWPEGGPQLLWTIKGLGQGFSTLSFVGDRFFTMGDLAPKGKEAGQYVLAYNAKKHTRLWATRIGPAHEDRGTGGSRCTPTVDGRLLYVSGTDGDLACLTTATGKIVWRKNFVKDFGGSMMSVWKFSESPLVDGDQVVCTPGGPDATIVALDKKTGNLIWKCAIPSLGSAGKDGAGYSSMVVAEIDGVRQYVQILGRGAVGVDAKTGKFLWGYNRIANAVANIPTPVVRGNQVFVTTSYETGSALLEITRDGDRWNAKEVYFLKYSDFENHHGGVILDGDFIYGGSGRNNGTLVCLDMATGKIAWKQKPVGKRSVAVLYADGHFVFRYEDGVVALVEANSKEFKLKGKFRPPVVDGPAWAYPVIHDGKLYLRAHDALMCYDVKGE
jgi:outer membrane protein assembly factor BamB